MNEILFLDDKNISINISTHGPNYLLSIYEDINGADDKAIFTIVSREKLKELADLILAVTKVSI
jgi:hypothetical protein